MTTLAAALGWSNEDEWSDRLVERGLASRQPGDGVEMTVAGALFLIPDVTSMLSKAYVEVFRYPEVGSALYDKRTEIRGPVNEQVRQATQLVLDELGVDQVVLGTFRHELPRLPPVVVREAIANAVAHRSYENNTTAVRISIYPDSVVVRSPGAFPEPVTEQNIRDTNAPRNPATIRVLRQMGLAEDAGMGVDRMQDEMRAEMLQPPRFVGSDIAVEVTLPITGTVAPREKAWIREVEDRGETQPQDRIVLVHAARGEVLTNARVREILSIDSVEARQVLQRLRDVGFLRQSGERGGSQYSLAEGLNPPAGLRLTPQELKKLVIDLAQSGPITNGTIREATGLGRDEVKQLLRELVEEGKLVLMGARRGAFYVLPGSEDSSQLPLRMGD
jgi:ATP-dependent DNA helicase RecG